MAGNIREWQRFAGDSHAVVIVVAPLTAFILQHRNVNGDFDGGMIPAHPFDGGFKVGVAGDNDHGIGEAADGVVQQVDGDVDVGLFFLGHIVFEATLAIAGAAGDGAFLVFAGDNLNLGQRAEGLEIAFLAVAALADMVGWVNEGGEELDGDDLLIQPQGFKKGLDVEPFPTGRCIKMPKYQLKASKYMMQRFLGGGVGAGSVMDKKAKMGLDLGG